MSSRHAVFGDNSSDPTMGVNIMVTVEAVTGHLLGVKETGRWHLRCHYHSYPLRTDGRHRSLPLDIWTEDVWKSSTVRCN